MMIEIVDYKPTREAEFLAIGSRIRAALGSDDLAIHHVGSTSVPNLAAKDIIDVQITVTKLEEDILKPKLEQAGLVWRDGLIHDHCPPGMQIPESDLEKFHLREVEGIRRTHVHIRIEGRFNQHYALLCRDFLRSHEVARDAYAEIKRQLARYFPENISTSHLHFRFSASLQICHFGGRYAVPTPSGRKFFREKL